MRADQDVGHIHPAGKSPGPPNGFAGREGTRECSGRPEAPRLSTIYVVHEDPAELESLSALFRAPGMRIELFATVDQFLTHELADGPGCVVLDARRPGRVVLALQAALLGHGLELPLVCITRNGDSSATSSATLRAIGHQGHGRVEPDQHDVVAGRVTTILEEQKLFGGREAEAQVFERNLGSLTDREREVAELVVDGRPNKRIARDLGISIETVKVHRARVMRKMNADSLARLARSWERYASQVE